MSQEQARAKLKREFKLASPPPRTKHDDPTIRESSASFRLSLLSLGMGLVYGLAGTRRFSSASYDLARDIGPFWVWGIIFGLHGVILLVTIHRRSHWAFLLLGAALYVPFALGAAISFTRAGASFTFVFPLLMLWIGWIFVDEAMRRIHNQTVRENTPQ